MNNYSDIVEINGYDDFFKDDLILVVKFGNGIVKKL